MVQYFGNTKSHSGYLADALGPALGQGLGEFTGSYFANKALDKVINDPSLADAEPSERLSRLQAALSPYGERGAKMFQKRIGIEQQRLQEQQLKRQEREQGVLARAIRGEPVTPEEMAKMSPETQLKLVQQKRNLDVSKNLEKNLVGRGIDPETAKSYSELYRDATEGGKTSILNNLLDLESRGLLGSQAPTAEVAQEPIGAGTEKEFKWPDLPQQKGLKPSDVVKREGDREKTNIPLYNEAVQKSKAAKEEGMSLRRLTQLNESGKLPQGTGRLFLDPKTGELAFPAGTSPETQLFVKTLNDFTTKAKDSYGSRVTNFDLDQFMKRLPSLANTTEGRKLILKQMEVINRLNALDADSIKETYNHYGVGRINAQEARKISDQFKDKKEEALLKEYEDLGGLLGQPESASESMPEAGFVRMQNPENGEIWDIPDSDSQEALKAGWTKQ